MSDLISRSELIKELNKYCGNQRYLVSENIREIINNQPTAYSVDKVIKELEKELSLADKEKERCTGENNLQFDSAKGYASGISTAIEIVKQGGVSDDVCEWRFEETNGIAWHCDDKCTTYNQVYIKDLKITLEDFECKCPYCGKKIKVVE